MILNQDNSATISPIATLKQNLLNSSLGTLLEREFNGIDLSQPPTKSTTR
jgi:hypothetical protein